MVINGVVADLQTAYQDTVISGNGSAPGKYLFVENIQFSYAVDATVLADIPFNISLNYSDYAGIDRTDSCTLLIDDAPSALDEITLPEGSHTWNISCSHPGMPSKELSGTIVANTFLVEYPSVYRFVPFLVNVTYYDTTLCNFDLDEAVEPMDATGQREVVLTDIASHQLNITCGEDSQVFTLSAIDTRTTWDREEVVGRFWVEDRTMAVNRTPSGCCRLGM